MNEIVYYFGDNRYASCRCWSDDASDYLLFQYLSELIEKELLKLSEEHIDQLFNQGMNSRNVLGHIFFGVQKEFYNNYVFASLNYPYLNVSVKEDSVSIDSASGHVRALTFNICKTFELKDMTVLGTSNRKSTASEPNKNIDSD